MTKYVIKKNIILKLYELADEMFSVLDQGTRLNHFDQLETDILLIKKLIHRLCDKASKQLGFPQSSRISNSTGFHKPSKR